MKRCSVVCVCVLGLLAVWLLSSVYFFIDNSAITHFRSWVMRDYSKSLLILTLEDSPLITDFGTTSLNLSSFHGESPAPPLDTLLSSHDFILLVPSAEWVPALITWLDKVHAKVLSTESRRNYLFSPSSCVSVNVLSNTSAIHHQMMTEGTISRPGRCIDPKKLLDWSVLDCCKGPVRTPSTKDSDWPGVRCPDLEHLCIRFSSLHLPSPLADQRKGCVERVHFEEARRCTNNSNCTAPASLCVRLAESLARHYSFVSVHGKVSDEWVSPCPCAAFEEPILFGSASSFAPWLQSFVFHYNDDVDWSVLSHGQTFERAATDSPQTSLFLFFQASQSGISLLSYPESWATMGPSKWNLLRHPRLTWPLRSLVENHFRWRNHGHYTTKTRLEPLSPLSVHGALRCAEFIIDEQQRHCHELTQKSEL